MNIIHQKAKILLSGFFICVFLLSGMSGVAVARDTRPSDSHLAFQDYLKDINAEEAWQVTKGSKKVVVAVIDTGVDLDHSDLRDNIWRNENEIPDNGIDDDENGYVDDMVGWDFVANDNDPNPALEDDYHKNAINHGTVMSGIIAGRANNQKGIAGISWYSKIMPLRVLDHQGMGTTDVVARAIDYAVDNGASVINLSFVGRGNSDTLRRSIENAYKQGVVVVAAAGNEVNLGQDMDMEENRSYPVCYKMEDNIDTVIGVASVNAFDRLAGFSNYGADCVDVSAPGVRLYSTAYYDARNRFFRDKYLGGWTGTSVSAPVVAGVVALVRSVNPNLPVSIVQEIIKKTARNVDLVNEPEFWGKVGAGVVDAEGAVKEALKISVGLEKDLIVAVGDYSEDSNLIRLFEKNHLQKETVFVESEREVVNVKDSDRIFVPAIFGEKPYLKIYNKQGKLVDSFLVFDESFEGGFSVDTRDLDGDGIREVVVGAGVGGGPQVKIFNQKGKLLGQFFAFDESFRDGIDVAVLEFDQKNSGAEILVAGVSGGVSTVRVFQIDGILLDQFEVFDENDCGVGFEIAGIDVDLDKRDELVVASGIGTTSQVQIIDNNKKVLSEFLAFGESYKGGVSLVVGDYDGDGYGEIIAGAKSDGGPHVRIFNGQGEYEFQFFAFDKKLRRGVRVF